LNQTFLDVVGVICNHAWPLQGHALAKRGCTRRDRQLLNFNKLLIFCELFVDCFQAVFKKNNPESLKEPPGS
jgi:hypothetical protein